MTPEQEEQEARKEYVERWAPLNPGTHDGWTIFLAGWEAALASHAPSQATAQPTPIARYCHHCDNWREGTHPHGEIEHNDH